MELRDERGIGVDVRVTGYQFPEAEDPGKRFSWHMLQGAATSPDGRWEFRWQALTCNETPRVSHWLRAWAAGTGVNRLSFLEPNLAFEVLSHEPDWVELRIELNLEFAAHWKPDRHLAGDPYGIIVRLSRAALASAADTWDEAVAPYPDVLAEGV